MLCSKVHGLARAREAVNRPLRSMPTFPFRPSRPFVPVCLLACVLSLVLARMPTASAAPAATLDQVEALLRDGHLNQADHAVAQVLAAQPKSARAH